MPGNRHVFLNFPYDARYKPLYRALVFTVHDCGFFARCALEQSDTGIILLDKLFGIIEECAYGIHDISRTQLDQRTRLPRFNMPLELGIFLGAQRFGSKRQRAKRILILDATADRYERFISDLSGEDVRGHNRTASGVIHAVRSWLFECVPNLKVPAAPTIARRFAKFSAHLPRLCAAKGLHPHKLGFCDYQECIQEWRDNNGK